MLFPYNQLLAAGCEYLRYDHGCYLLAWERGPWESYGHRPDLLGVERGRRVIEIEIKRTLADFKNDANKKIWLMRERTKFNRATPFKFYYMVPPDLVEKVIDIVPAGRGLLTLGTKESRGGNAEVIVVSPAKVNRKATLLTLKEMFTMARDQSGTLVSAITKVAKAEQSTVAP